MGGDYALNGLAVPQGLDALHDLLEQIGAEHPELSGADLMLFETAVIEIAGNVVEHGVPAGEVTWEFALSVLPERLEATLSDDGAAYDGTVISESAMPDELAESGRGFALASAVLDRLDYRRDNEGNHWEMVRYRT